MVVNYRHFCLDVTDESRVKEMFSEIRKTYQRLSILINNAGIAAMNHILLTPMETVHKVLGTNVTGDILCCPRPDKAMKGKFKWPHG